MRLGSRLLGAKRLAGGAQRGRQGPAKASAMARALRRLARGWTLNAEARSFPRSASQWERCRSGATSFLASAGGAKVMARCPVRSLEMFRCHVQMTLTLLSSLLSSQCHISKVVNVCLKHLDVQAEGLAVLATHTKPELKSLEVHMT